MHVSFSLHRIALVVALALLGLAVPVSAAQANDFRASGTFTVTAVQGAHFELTLSGRAAPGGQFTGTALGTAVAHGNTQYAVLMMDFGRGDTLTFDVVVERDAESGLLVGTYVITGGTGRLAEASGNGSCVFLGAPLGGTGEFAFDGTLSH